MQKLVSIDAKGLTARQRLQIQQIPVLDVQASGRMCILAYTEAKPDIVVDLVTRIAPNVEILGSDGPWN